MSSTSFNRVLAYAGAFALAVSAAACASSREWNDSRPTEGGMTSGGWAPKHVTQIAMCKVEAIQLDGLASSNPSEAVIVKSWIGAGKDTPSYEILLEQTAVTHRLMAKHAFSRDGHISKSEFNLDGRQFELNLISHAGVLESAGSAVLKAQSESTITGEVSWRREPGASEQKVKLMCTKVNAETKATENLPKKVACHQVDSKGLSVSGGNSVVATLNANGTYRIDVTEIDPLSKSPRQQSFKELVAVVHNQGRAVDLRSPDLQIQFPQSPGHRFHSLDFWDLQKTSPQQARLTIIRSTKFEFIPMSCVFSM